MTITIEDLIKAGKSEVRLNSNLMSAYISLFEEKFRRKPDCAGCTFDSDWNRLINNQNLRNITIMSDKTFILRDNSIIYSFDKEDKKTKRLMRSRIYGNIMTEQFAEDYLTYGTEDQIEARKRQFKVLPAKFQPKAENSAGESIYPEKLADMKALAASKGYPEDEYSSITRKADMLVYLEGKDIESAEEDEDETDDDIDSLVDTSDENSEDEDEPKGENSAGE